MREFDITLPDGRTLHVYDVGDAHHDPGPESSHDSGMPVIWHHGTPNLGAPPRPLLALAEELGLRWISFDRPAYGGSSPHPGRTIGSVADDTVALADALGLTRFAVLGHSGGGPHALACAAAHPHRVMAAVSVAGLAPIDAAGLDWFAGFGPSGAASLRAAQRGADAKLQHERAAVTAPIDFTDADWAALTGPWGWLGEVAEAASAQGMDGLIEDDLAYVTSWGVDLAQVTAPVLLLHGEQDRVVPAAHSRWLAQSLSTSELWLHPDDSHISVLARPERGAADALRWLAEHAP